MPEEFDPARETPTDEELSEIVDGDADESLLARVAADPRSTARLERMRLAKELVSEQPEPASADRRAASISAALTAFDTPANVSSLSAERAKSDSAKRRNTFIATAVAASVLVLALVGINQLAEEDADTSESATAFGEALSQEDEFAGDAAEATAETTTSEAESVAPDEVESSSADEASDATFAPESELAPNDATTDGDLGADAADESTSYQPQFNPPSFSLDDPESLQLSPACRAQLTEVLEANGLGSSDRVLSLSIDPAFGTVVTVWFGDFDNPVDAVSFEINDCVQIG